MSYRRRLRLGVAALVSAALASTACAQGTEADAQELSGRQIRIATTTNFISDTVRQIAGDRAVVNGLMGPGVDPHLYKASAGDVRTLREADVIVYGGLELEGRMADLFDELAETRTTVAISEAAPEARLLPLAGPTEFGGRFDPHLWFDPTLWSAAMEQVAATLSAADPVHAGEYRARLAALQAEVDAVDADCRRRLDAVPERSRLLVTSHDAFAYFGRHYGLDVEAIQGISTATEATTADIERIAGLLSEREVPAVFVESSVSPQTVEAVIASAGSRGQQVEIGGELFSDAAGEEGTAEGTYPGMLAHNCQVVAQGLTR